MDSGLFGSRALDSVRVLFKQFKVAFKPASCVVDIDLARHVIRTAFRSSRELGGLLGVLKQHCKPDEYDGHARDIAAVIASIQLKVVGRITAARPELDAEIETMIAKYDRYL